jgi:RNA polymerase sigma-70 factor (ECF subfamily)
MSVERQRPTSERRRGFEALLNAHDRDLRMLVYRLLGDRDQMDTVLQKVYVQAYGSLLTFEDDPATTSRLYYLTYRACVDHLRDRSRISYKVGRAESLHTLGETDLETTEGAARSDSERRLEAALASLPFERRAAIILVDVLGFGYSETAKILGVREGALVSRLPSARRLLLDGLAASGEGHR